MVDAGFSGTGHWAWGAVIAVLCSFAYAKSPEIPHGGGSLYGGLRAGHALGGGMRYDARGKPPLYRALAERAKAPDRKVRLPRSGSAYGSGLRGDGVFQRAAAEDRYAYDGRGSMQYVGAITPVSTESRSVPRPPVNEAVVRTGSIRADVARYNEERGLSRSMPRPPDESARPPGESPYRN